jgi:hypothetical protein
MTTRQWEGALLLAAVAAVATSTVLDPAAYGFLLGALPPLPVAVGVAGAGALGLRVLRNRRDVGT